MREPNPSCKLDSGVNIDRQAGCAASGAGPFRGGDAGVEPQRSGVRCQRRRCAAAAGLQGAQGQDNRRDAAYGRRRQWAAAAADPWSAANAPVLVPRGAGAGEKIHGHRAGPARLRRQQQAGRWRKTHQLFQAHDGARQGGADAPLRLRPLRRRRPRSRRARGASSRTRPSQCRHAHVCARHRAHALPVHARDQGFRRCLLPLVPVHPPRSVSGEHHQRESGELRRRRRRRSCARNTCAR